MERQSLTCHKTAADTRPPSTGLSTPSSPLSAYTRALHVVASPARKSAPGASPAKHPVRIASRTRSGHQPASTMKRLPQVLKNTFAQSPLHTKKRYWSIKPMFQSGRWRLHPGDTVLVRAGPHKGQTGKILEVIKDKRVPHVIVEGVNMVSSSQPAQASARSAARARKVYPRLPATYPRFVCPCGRRESERLS